MWRMKALDGRDVPVEVNAPSVAGTMRVGPVGDVDLVRAEQGLHGVAQQRGVWPDSGATKHGRSSFMLRSSPGVVAEALEAQQPAGGVRSTAFHHRALAAVDLDFVDAELRLLVVLADAVQRASRQPRGASTEDIQLCGEDSMCALASAQVENGSSQARFHSWSW